MTQMTPPAYTGQVGTMKPHRGTLVLVLGILGLVICQICGVIAWILANGDLKEMDAGRMDPSGRSNTQAGKICGIIATVMMCLGLVLTLVWLLFFVVFVGAVAAGAAGAAGSGGTP